MTTSFSRFRGLAILLLIGTGLVALAGRVAYLQTYGRQQVVQKADVQHHRKEVLPARRGSIFDCNGALLACTILNQGVFVDPKFMHDYYQTDGRSLTDMDAKVRELAPLLEYDGQTLGKLIGDKSEERYVKLADSVDEPTVKAIQNLDIPGVGFFPVSQRVYPMGGVAAHILGGVGKEGAGLEGVEKQFEKVLAGHDGQQRVMKDARRRSIAVTEEDYVPPQHGQHLMLTIDANIQMIAEQELADTCSKVKAKRGELVVLDAKTGEVLALANWPTYNPQDMNDSTPEARTNNALVAPFEPGSALKPFIAGPAMQDGVVTWGHMWPINSLSWSTPYGRRITDTHGYGPLSMWDVLVKSSNIGMSMLAEKYTNPKVYAAITRFGFGQYTGIELPGENHGRVRPLKDWGKTSTDSVAQGYELMVTPLQLAHAMQAYANDGKQMPVHIAKGLLDDSGHVVARPTRTAPTQPIDSATAAKIRRILADVPLRGTGSTIKSKNRDTKQWLVDNWWTWNIFGKTGTAHISEGASGYSGTRYNSTFLGAAPYEDPRLVIAFVVHEPDRAIAHYGGEVSGPGAARVLVRSLSYLQAPPSPQLPLPPQEVIGHLVNFQANVYNKPTTRPTGPEAVAHPTPARHH